MPYRKALPIFRRWAASGTWSVLDQGLLSSSNFVVALLFGRWLPPQEYGAFAIGLTVFLLVSGFHNALIMEPMCVLGPKCNSIAPREYFRTVLKMHAIGALVLWCATPLVSGAVSRLGLPATTVSAGTLVSPFILTLWLLRRACYVWHEPRLATLGSVVYAVALAILTPASTRWMTVTPQLPFFLMGAASVIASAVLAFLHHRHFAASTSAAPADRYSIWTGHWHYGRWAIGVSGLYWVTESIYPSLLARSGSLAGAGAYRAAENLLQPIVQVMTSLTLLLLPQVSRRYDVEGAAYLRKYRNRGAVLALALVGTYACVLELVAPTIIRTVYNRPEYLQLPSFLPILAAALLVRAVSDFSLATSLRATGESRLVLVGTAASCALTLGLGPYLTNIYGISGSVCSKLASNVAQCAALFLAFRYYLSTRPSSHRQEGYDHVARSSV